MVVANDYSFGQPGRLAAGCCGGEAFLPGTPCRDQRELSLESEE